ncbi:MAG: hypothetical protein R3F11_19030 [Verrucomicrobiales bacterium]
MPDDHFSRRSGSQISSEFIAGHRIARLERPGETPGGNRWIESVEIDAPRLKPPRNIGVGDERDIAIDGNAPAEGGHRLGAPAAQGEGRRA